jgi:maleate isomerase
MRPTLDMVLACEPDRIVVAYSPEYMNDGVHAASQLRRIFEDRLAIPVTLASDAVPEALKAFGATRVGLVTPFLPEAARPSPKAIWGDAFGDEPRSDTPN